MGSACRVESHTSDVQARCDAPAIEQPECTCPPIASPDRAGSPPRPLLIPVDAAEPPCQHECGSCLANSHDDAILSGHRPQRSNVGEGIATPSARSGRGKSTVAMSPKNTRSGNGGGLSVANSPLNIHIRHPNGGGGGLASAALSNSSAIVSPRGRLLRTAIAAPMNGSAFSSILPTFAEPNRHVVPHYGLNPLPYQPNLRVHVGGELDISCCTGSSSVATTTLPPPPIWQPLCDHRFWTPDEENGDVCEESSRGTIGAISGSAFEDLPPVRQRRSSSLNGSFESVDHSSSGAGTLSRRSTGEGSGYSLHLPLAPQPNSRSNLGPPPSIGGSMLDTGVATPRRLSGASAASGSERPRRITFLGDDLFGGGSSSFSVSDHTPLGHGLPTDHIVATADDVVPPTILGVGAPHGTGRTFLFAAAVTVLEGSGHDSVVKQHESPAQPDLVDQRRTTPCGNDCLHSFPTPPPQRITIKIDSDLASPKKDPLSPRKPASPFATQQQLLSPKMPTGMEGWGPSTPPGSSPKSCQQSSDTTPLHRHQRAHRRYSSSGGSKSPLQEQLDQCAHQTGC